MYRHLRIFAFLIPLLLLSGCLVPQYTTESLPVTNYAMVGLNTGDGRAAVPRCTQTGEDQVTANCIPWDYGTQVRYRIQPNTGTPDMRMWSANWGTEEWGLDKDYGLRTFQTVATIEHQDSFWFGSAVMGDDGVLYTGCDFIAVNGIPWWSCDAAQTLLRLVDRDDELGPASDYSNWLIGKLTALDDWGIWPTQDACVFSVMSWWANYPVTKQAIRDTCGIGGWPGQTI